MALDNAESVLHALPLSDTLERVPDSSPLRVSSNTAFESGIPPARLREDRDALVVQDRELSLETGVDRADLALATVARTEANLGLLIRGLKHLAAGASAAREANGELMHELDGLRLHLSRSAEQEQALRFRMTQLEQLLDVIRHESSSERAFLIEQQDLFLVEILNDHERQLADLRRMLSDANARRAEASELSELIAQRDQAREYATRCERERDLAWHELATAQPGPSSSPAVTLRRPTPAPEPSGTSKSAATAIGSISLRAVSVPAKSSPAAALASDGERSPRSGTGYSLAGEDLGE